MQIDAKSSDMIVEHVGADLSRLVSELDKIILSLDDKNRIITPEMVEQKIGISKEFNTFELRSAIINKDVYKQISLSTILKRILSRVLYMPFYRCCSVIFKI